jgi:glucosamine kinase
MVQAEFVLGVDGGATRSRVRIRDRSGAVRGEATGGAANIHVDEVATIAQLRATIGSALAGAGLGSSDSARIAVGVGLAGVHAAEHARPVVDAFSGFARVVVANDAEIGCLGAHAGADGAVVIAGTGSAAFARLGERRIAIGGRGFTIGDAGSAARLGCDALRLAVLAQDGLAPHSGLTRALMARFGDDPLQVVAWAKTADPGAYGALAPVVFAHAKDGDPIAAGLVAGAAAAVADLGQRMRREGAPRIALVGGIASAIAAHLTPESAGIFSPALLDGTDGAILLAGGVVADAERLPA